MTSWIGIAVMLFFMAHEEWAAALFVGLVALSAAALSKEQRR